MDVHYSQLLDDRKLISNVNDIFMSIPCTSHVCCVGDTVVDEQK